MSGTSVHNPLTFAVLRRLADGEFHSGESLARQFDVARTTVHNALQDVAQYGLVLHRVRGRGYQLVAPFEWLDVGQIEAQLDEARGSLQIDLLDHATSSNALLLQRAGQGAASGSVLAVEWQSAGRGRLGRTWQSGLGGALTFSVLWRFESGLAALSGLSLAVGVAMVRALHELGVQGVSLKWPNDVLLGEGKLAGILLEAQGDMLGPSAVVIGIGLNLRLSPQARERIDQMASDLSALQTPAGRNQVLAVSLKHLLRVLREFTQHNFIQLREEWERYNSFQQRVVKVSSPDGTVVWGKMLGVTKEGALRLETEQGERIFNSGEVSLRGG